MELTHFQEIVAMALDLPDTDAAKVTRAWPKTEEALRKALRQWKVVTGSKVKGHDLLSICGEVWRHKPIGLSEAEGREILYHPLDGDPIPEGAPLDGLSWEMLAFLRWSLQNGYLRFSDEVTIAREIKETGCIIEALPADRFYAKGMLPRVPGGNIDWSDVALAQAKAAVTTGKQNAGLSAGSKLPVYYDDTSLRGVLASIPALQDEAARSHLLRGLPDGACGAIRRSTAPATDLANIVEAVEGFGLLSDGRIATDVVIDNALRLVRGTVKTQRLEAFKSDG